jgi:hypothetical protein
MSEYRVPRLMWEALESSLNVAGKRFVKRLAAALEVPEKELAREVFKKDDLKVCIHDWTDEEFMCPCWKAHGDVYIPCDNVKTCGKETCRDHVGFRRRMPGKELSRVGYLIHEDTEIELGDATSAPRETKMPLDNLVFYKNLGNVVGNIGDLKKLIKKDKISIDDFIDCLTGYCDEDGTLKIAE